MRRDIVNDVAEKCYVGMQWTMHSKFDVIAIFVLGSANYFFNCWLRDEEE